MEIEVQQGPFLQPANLTWWQKILALLGVCAALVVAAVVGVIILYVLLFMLTIACLVGAYLYIRWRFFRSAGVPPRPRHGSDNITIIETSEGVVVDIPANDPSAPPNRQNQP
ncbi:MAG: hypothetical protein AAF607_06685 [Pseudomonadota bacterium]